MLSWVKELLAHVKQSEGSRSNGSGVSTISGGGEEPECAEDCLHILVEEEFHKTNNDDHIRHFPTPPPSTSSSAPPSSHHTPSSPPSLSTRISGAPALQPPHVNPALPPCNQPRSCSQPPTPSNTRPTPPSSMPFVNLLESSTSRNTNANAQSIPENDMHLGSQQRPPVCGEDSSAGQENQSEDTLQAAAGNVLGPTVDETSYPSCFLTAALTSAIGQLVTVLDEKYVLVRVMGKVLMVSLNAGSSNIPPCRLVWRAGQPVPLIELPDSTFVEIDAVVCPESKKLHAAVIWQDTKPKRCLQLLDDTYLFLDRRSVTYWPSFEDILAKKLTVLGFDGTIVSAEVCDAVVFIGQAKATLIELLQHNFEQCNATVYKVLQGTGGGRVLYVCTCVWVGQKPPTSNLPMVINRQTLYAKESHGFYTKTEKKVTLCLDVDARLCVSDGTATLKVDLDGSLRSLKATHPLDLEPGCQEAVEATRVSVHVSKENLVAFSAVMIKPPDSTALGAILNEMPAWDLSKTAPHCPSDSKDKPMKVCKSASAGHNADGQQVRVSSSIKASAPVAQKASVPAAQNTPNTNVQNTLSTAAQKTPNAAAQSIPKTAEQNTPSTAAQKYPNAAAQSIPKTAEQNTPNTAAQKGSVPSTQKTSGTAAQKTSGKAAKTNKKSASLSQLSDTGQQQLWGYLSCRVLTADSCVAVVTGAGKKIIVEKGDIFVSEAPVPVKDNVASILKEVKNLNVIYTQSQEVREVHGHSVDLVTVAAWTGKKPSFINNIVEQRLPVLKKVAVPEVNQTPPATPKVTQTPTTNLKMTPTPPAAPKGTPVSPAPLPAGETTVDATCMMMKISQHSVTLIVRSKFLPGNCGTAQARLCDMYDNLTPMTQTEAEKVRDKVWHCQLEIKNNGKQLMVPLAWRGMKPVNHAFSRSTVSPQPRQALSTGDLTSSSSRPPETAAFVPQTPPSSPPKSGEPKMVSKTVLGIVCAIAAGVLLFTVGNVKDIHDHSKALVKGWEAYGPHTTAVGRLRVLLASLTWLGPLRPNALWDPLRECGMPQAHDGWWTARRRLACLEDHIAKALADHSLFERKLIINITVSFLALVYFLLAKVPRDVPGFSLSGKVILGNARLAEQRQSWNYSSGHISRHRRLKDDEKAALSRRRRKKAGKKVLRGEVTEVLAEGGLLRGKDGRVYLFSLEVCFLYGVCLHQVEPSEVLHVGMTVEFEVTERRRSRRNKKVEAAVQRVWIEGEDASLAFPPTDSLIESWCSGNGVSSATRDALKQEAELLSPSLFPTALKMETTTTVDITS